MVGSGVSFGTRNVWITTSHLSLFRMTDSDSIACVATPPQRRNTRLVMNGTSRDFPGSPTAILWISHGLLLPRHTNQRRRLPAENPPQATSANQQRGIPLLRRILCDYSNFSNRRQFRFQRGLPIRSSWPSTTPSLPWRKIACARYRGRLLIILFHKILLPDRSPNRPLIQISF